MRLSWYTVLVSLLVLAVVAEALSVIEWAAYPYFPDKSLLFAKTDAAIFDLLAPFSPALLILLLYTWVPRLAISFDNKFSKRLKNIFKWLAQSLSSLNSRVPPDSVNRFTLTDRPRLLLVVAVASAILLALVPYRPNLNPAMTPVGVDAHYYVDWVSLFLRNRERLVWLKTADPHTHLSSCLYRSRKHDSRRRVSSSRSRPAGCVVNLRLCP